ncbi:MAG: hypothetical protein K9L75_00695 [Spirochaetia bacterium]|nr:hypothetical protein [Spirochaetia bacterium]
MKKTLCIIGVILLITSMTLMAQPMTVDSMFNEAGGEPLSQEEMEGIEGEGLFASLVGGFFLGSLGYLTNCMYSNQSPTWGGAIVGGCIGMISAYSPSLSVLAGMNAASGTSLHIPSSLAH